MDSNASTPATQRREYTLLQNLGGHHHHPITGDLNIIQYESLRKVISHGPKFREPQHINWKHNFKIIMDAVEDYARRWIKREVDQDPGLESPCQTGLEQLGL